MLPVVATNHFDAEAATFRCPSNRRDSPSKNFGSINGS
jgi:hypothetical protein